MGSAACVRNDDDPANSAGPSLGFASLRGSRSLLAFGSLRETCGRLRRPPCSVGIFPRVMPRIVLYGPRVMPLTEKVGRALRVKQLAFEVVEPASADDYKRLSPETGLLPVLEVDGA